jgi:uncharacterized membrane protein YagU involved in acid resistance
LSGIHLLNDYYYKLNNLKLNTMKTKIQQAVLGGIVATAVMTMVILMAPLMGMSKMNPAAMLADMMGLPIIIGWIMHFMIGVIFALAYVFILSGILGKISSKIVKGALFGFIVFLFAQVMMGVISAVMGGMPAPEGSKTLVILGGIIGHIVYGIVVALFVPNKE